MSTLPPKDDDDDFELELEPVDPEVIAHQQARGQQVVDAAVKKVDVDELYEGHGNYSDLDFDLSGLKGFRFTTRHLLLVTAILAIGLTIKITLGGCMAIFVGMVAAVAVGWYWVSRLERQQQADRARRREEFFSHPGKPAVAAAETPPAKQPTSPFDPESAPAPQAAPAEKRPLFDVTFAFSMKEALLTMTAAAIAMGLATLMPREYLAMVLGLIALGGLAVNAAGYEPPRLVALGWWLLMIFYLGVGLFAAVERAGP